MSEEIIQPVVLMYHGVLGEQTLTPSEREVGAELYDVQAETFREQMSWLKENDCFVTTMDRHLDVEHPNNVILTFDDGEMNNFTEAFPVLRELRFPGYFFIIAKRVGHQGYMGWEELQKLYQGGMVIGSHGLSHEILTNLKETQIEEELKASKKNLEINLGITVDSFSIPRGFCDDKILRMAYAVGYKKIFISDRPRNLKLNCYSRTAVKSHWSMKRFEQAISRKVPIAEVIGTPVKKLVKKVLRESMYNRLRNVVIKTTK